MQIPEAVWLALVGAAGSIMTVIVQRILPKSPGEREKEKADIAASIGAQWQDFIGPYREERKELLIRIDALQEDIERIKEERNKDAKEWFETLRQRDSYIKHLLSEQQAFILKITQYEDQMKEMRRMPVTGILRYIEEREALLMDGKDPDAARPTEPGEPRHSGD